MKSVYEPADDVAIAVYPTVAKERPPTSHLLAALEVNVYDLFCLRILRSLINHLSLRSADEA